MARKPRKKRKRPGGRPGAKPPAPPPPLPGKMQQLLEQALARHQAGRPDEALILYQQVLEKHPRQVDALNLAGLALHQMGRHAEGVPLIERAIDLSPHEAGFKTNLGAALLALGRERLAANDPEAALTILKKAANATPEHPHIPFLIGNLLEETGDAKGAEEQFKKALTLAPSHAGAANNLGLLLAEAGRLQEADAAFRKAITAHPDLAEPGAADAAANLGRVLDQLGRNREAEELLVQLTERHPNHLGGLVNLGNLHLKTGQSQKGIPILQRALQVQPDHPVTWNSLGVSLSRLGRYAEAEQALGRALTLNPGYDEALCNRAVALFEQGRGDDGLPLFRDLLTRPQSPKIHSNFLLCAHYSAAVSPEELYRLARSWQEQHAPPAASILPHPNSPDPERRLRIGFVSPDFRLHSVSFFFEPLLAALDRQRFETFCYADVRRPDAMTARLKEMADHWRDVLGVPDDALAATIREERIDILVDLAGHSNNNRLPLFALKPAPLQATWMGYPDTSGLDAMDVRISDAEADPPGAADDNHSETVVRLPGGFLCYRPPKETPPVAPPPVAASGIITFGSFNNLAKTGPESVRLWARLLHEVAGARLFLKGRAFNDPGARSLFLDRFAAHGINAGRIDLLPPTQGLQEHLALYERIDIGLDPFPYNGTTTTCEALWMGVPVIALNGDRHAGRVGTSLLTRMGLTELLASSEEEYVRIAVELAGDRERLTGLRSSMRARMGASPLGDEAGFAREMESALVERWKEWCEERG